MSSKWTRNAAFSMHCRCVPERGHDDDCPNHPAFAPIPESSAANVRDEWITDRELFGAALMGLLLLAWLALGVFAAVAT